jgi:hypothetical protein
VVANSHHHAVDLTVGTVALRKLVPAPSEWWIVAQSNRELDFVAGAKAIIGCIASHLIWPARGSAGLAGGSSLERSHFGMVVASGE